MTTLVRTRQPLQVLSMSNQPERRHSKRLAGTSLPLLPSRPLPLARLPEQENQPPPAAGTKGRKRKDVEADVLPAATAVYEEQDGDFLFTRGSKRVKTAPVPEEETDPEPTPAPAPAKRGVGRPPKTGARRKASPPAPGLAPAPQPPPTQPRLAAPAATRRTSKRKTSLDYAPAVPPPEEDAVVLKSKTRRKARETTAERRPQPKAGRLAAQANEGYQGMEEEDGYEEEEDEQRDPPRRKEATSRAAAVPGPSSQAQMIALPFSDTPIINRNKEFRKKGGAAGGRRSSLGMRGRRASSLIDNGQSALPHREVDPAEFYKYIAAEGLSEPRRMKQLLIWCGERALSEKPPHGSQGSSAVLGARAIQDQLLKDFGARSEFSDWFAREDAPKPVVPVVLQPNPRNVDYDAKIAELEAKIERLKTQKLAWQAIAAPLPVPESLYPDHHLPPNSHKPQQQQQPDPTLLDTTEAAILTALTTPESAFGQFKRQARARLQNAQAGLEFAVDRLADAVHKLDVRVATAGREADAVLALGAGRLREREERERGRVGTREVPVLEVLRSLGRILPEGG